MDSLYKTLIRATALAAAIAVVGASGGCNASSADQCTMGASGDADCETVLHVSKGAASCDNGTCRIKEGPPTAQNPDGGSAACVSTTQCTAENGGKASVCLEPGVKPCVRLANELCDVSGDGWKQATKPIFVGVLLNTTVAAQGNATQPYDMAVQEDIQLSEGEWLEATTGGLNIGGERRPIVGIYCNIKLDPNVARAAFDHVTLGVGAPAVITESPQDVLAFIDAAKERNTFVYLTEYGSDVITLTGKLNGRTFTSEPAVEYTLPLIERWVADLEKTIRTERALAPTDKIKVVTLSTRDLNFTDASTGAYLDHLKQTLVFNGVPAKDQPAYYAEINPVYTADLTGDYAATAAAVTKVAPDIIVTLEARDFHLWYLPLIEATWPASAPHRPRYVTTESAAFPSRYAVSVGGNDALRRRASGVWAYIDPASQPLIDDFLGRYQSKYKKENVDQVITGVDAFYATAYGIAAALTTASVSSANLSGKDIGAAMARLVSGTKVEVKPSGIAPGIAVLAQGGSIDLLGLDSLLDWDPITGAAGVDASVYCVARGTNGIELLDTGLFYRYKTKAFEGTADLSLCP